MRQRQEQHNTTIIKRASRKGHYKHHGGAWKVAFADFTLAMMALFMVLWIMEAVKSEKNHSMEGNSEFMFNGVNNLPGEQQTVTAVQHYDTQKNVLAYDGKGTDTTVKPQKDPEQKHNSDQHQNSGQQKDEGQGKDDQQHAATLPKNVTEMVAASKTNTGTAGEARQQEDLEDLERIIIRITNAYHAQSNLKIGIVPEGLRILITDDNHKEMFQRGSAKITPFFWQLLHDFAPELNTLDNKIIITGHTDAMQYKNSKGYNNWNLSGERALQARTVLTDSGLQADKVLQVSGMADQTLLDSQDPFDSANRRIEIMVLTHSASDALAKFFGANGDKIIKPLAQKINQGK
ncbi:flagellar motor protein MotB [Enterobacter ludwigii]|uniref:flagellar motor protein MotB n=1 Tax=Enterobacter ludwigii TaxID=299767 RepID=UPI003F70E490